MKWRFPLAILIYAMISQAVHMFGSLFTVKYYQLPAYVSIWSKIMKPEAGLPSVRYYIVALMLGLIEAILFLIIFLVVRKSIETDNVWRTGLNYAFILVAVSIIPMHLFMILMFHIPIVLCFTWTVESWVVCYFGSVVYAALMKPVKMQKVIDDRL